MTGAAETTEPRPIPGELTVECLVRHRNMLLAGAALLGALALGPPSVSAQTTAADKEQCSQGPRGDQLNVTPKDGSEEKSKDEQERRRDRSPSEPFGKAR